jgi:hypothetical protein
MEFFKNVNVHNFVKYFLGGSVVTYSFVKIFKYIKILGPSAGLKEDLTGKTIVITGKKNLNFKFQEVQVALDSQQLNYLQNKVLLSFLLAEMKRRLWM